MGYVRFNCSSKVRWDVCLRLQVISMNDASLRIGCHRSHKRGPGISEHMVGVPTSSLAQGRVYRAPKLCNSFPCCLLVGSFYSRHERRQIGNLSGLDCWRISKCSPLTFLVQEFSPAPSQFTLALSTLLWRGGLWLRTVPKAMILATAHVHPGLPSALQSKPCTKKAVCRQAGRNQRSETFWRHGGS